MPDRPEPQKIFIPIGFKLIGIVSLILIASLGGIMLLATGNFGQTMERTLKDDTMMRAEFLSQKIDSDLRAVMDTGRIAAVGLQTGGQVSDTGADDASETLAAVPGLMAALLVSQDETGGWIIDRAVASNERLAANGLTMPQSLGLLGNHRALIDSSFSALSVAFNASPDFGYPMLGMAMPFVMRNQRQAKTVLVLILSMDKLLQSLDSRELYLNYVVDAEGRLVAHPDQQLCLAAPSLNSDPIVRDSLTSGANLKQRQYRDSAGQAQLASYKRFFASQLIMVSAIPQTAALADVYRLQRIIILAAIMILCAAILLLFFFSRSLTRPIGQLVAAARRIQEGIFGESIGGQHNDEIGHLALSFTEMSVGLAQREKYKNALGKFVNKEIAERVLHDEIQLGGELRQAAILFSDIRSFTAISENLTPHEVVEFLNEYMTSMVACVDQHNGLVDKFIGDAIMAVFGVPESSGNDTENAINAALAMRRSLIEFNKGRGGPRKPIIRIGIGINTGEVIAGQIGSSERMEYTCIGDAVNLASRIETLTKTFGTDLLVSEGSLEQVRGIYRVEAMRKVMVKGKEKAQLVYAVLGRKDDPGAPPNLAILRGQLGLEEPIPESPNSKHEDLRYVPT